MKKNKILINIVISLFLSIFFGLYLHNFVNIYYLNKIIFFLNLITNTFIKLINVIILPLIFSTISYGVSNINNISKLNKIGLKSMIWFIFASIISMLIGIFIASIFKPGLGMNLNSKLINSDIKIDKLQNKIFIKNININKLIQLLLDNKMINVLIFSIFFGIAISILKKSNNKIIIEKILSEFIDIIFIIINIIMKLTPLIIFSSISSIIANKGIYLLINYIKLILEFYLGLLLIWIILFIIGYLFLGNSIFLLYKSIKKPIFLSFITASSEFSYPILIKSLDKFGIKKYVLNLVLPLGYSFNLDGSMLYQTFAILFIVQAYNIDLSILQKYIILFTLMIMNKGMAGVARASIIVLSTTMHIFNFPDNCIMIIIGIDQFLDMGRTATNVIGNSIAAAVIDKSEK